MWKWAKTGQSIKLAQTMQIAPYVHTYDGNHLFNPSYHHVITNYTIFENFNWKKIFPTISNFLCFYTYLLKTLFNINPIQFFLKVFQVFFNLYLIYCVYKTQNSVVSKYLDILMEFPVAFYSLNNSSQNIHLMTLRCV